MTTARNLLKSIVLAMLGFATLAVQAGTSTITTNTVSLTKTVPDAAILGAAFEVTLTVTATADSADIKVTDEVPAGASLVSTAPQAEVSGSKLAWTIPTLNAGESKTITVSLRADKEGDLTGCSTLTAIPRCCVATFVGRPQLTIAKSGPERAFLNEVCNYSIVVTNTGTAIAKNVVVTDAVPQGLTHASGTNSVTFQVGDLAPQQSVTIPVALTAAARGRFCNVATAASENTASVNDDACTVVVQQLLEVAKTGTKEQYLGKVASYQITINNPGDTSLTNVVVTDTAPAATKVLDAPGATVTGNTITWTVAELAAGASKSFDVTLTSRVEGTHCNGVSVATTEGLTGKAEACTIWKGYPAVLIEVIDTVDPLLVGEATTYVVRVTNQGTANDTNVGITCRFPAEISPTKAGGATDATVAGKTVNTKPFPVLAPGQVIEWRVDAKADAVGDSRLKVELTTDLLKTPVVEEESTHVY